MVDGELLQVLASEVELIVSPKAGYSSAAEGPYLVALVIEVDRELRAEGLAREFVRRVQELRKQAGYLVDDRIHIEHASTPDLAEAVEVHRHLVAAETLALSIDAVEAPSGESTSEFAFEDQRLRLGLARAKREDSEAAG